ncbi:PASTA domain-containing protein [Herbihabitans rhizosphaerae]|uniref:PASTA domain-containing protein n=1 Tax=Herbihabitans rhizosphaerae TaxID=1872711 RepID=UPI003BF89268
MLKNSTVVIEVSKGPQANEITVPDLEGKTVSEAEAILRGMGWTGTSSTQDVMTADRDKDGRIAQHIPDADAKIAKNGTIQLLVYRFPGGGSTTTRPTLPWPPNQ